MNLFALELGSLLTQHGLTLSYLYTLRSPVGAPAIAPAKIARLQRSLSDDVSALLAHHEIDALANALALTSAEVARLHAAYVGEAVRRVLAGRISGISALEEGERVIDLVMREGAQEEGLRDELMADPSTGELNLPSADVNAAIADALDDAAEACEQGELWTAVAATTPLADLREDFLAMAWAALDRAAQLLAVAGHVAQGSSAQSEWRSTVERALETVRSLRRIQ